MAQKRIKKITIDLDQLKNVIADRGVTITDLSETLGIARNSLYNKLDAKTAFQISEINALLVCLFDSSWIKIEQ